MKAWTVVLLLPLGACDPQPTPAPPPANGVVTLPSASAPPGLGEATERKAAEPKDAPAHSATKN